MSEMRQQSGASRLARETTCFVIASCLDLLMTWFLIGVKAGDEEIRFVEGNPVARFFLTGWGFNGLMGFKFAMIAVVIASCWMIGSQRIGTAKRVLEFAVVTGVAVVFYSVTLAIHYS